MPPRWHVRWRALPRSLRVLLILIAAALAFRIALPFIVKGGINWQLSRVQGYRGHVGDVSLRLWRGGYSIEDIKIDKTEHSRVPFFSARALSWSINWSELLRGILVGEVRLDEPGFTYVTLPVATPWKGATGGGGMQPLDRLFPFRLDKVQIKHGRARFLNPYSNPPVDVSVENLMVMATNITNSRKVTAKLPAGLHASGTTIGGGGFEMQMQANPVMKLPTLQLTAQLTNLNLVALNEFLRAYGKFDVSSGTFSLFTSFAAEAGSYDGYAKIFFTDLEVFDLRQDRRENIVQRFWEAIVGTVAEILSNPPRDQLATRIPISGSFETTDVDVWTAAGTLLQNAFLRSLVPALDERVTVPGAK